MVKRQTDKKKKVTKTPRRKKTKPYDDKPRLKRYRCRCSTFVDPEIEPIGYSNRLCKDCYIKALNISKKESIEIEKVIEQHIPFVPIDVSRII